MDWGTVAAIATGLILFAAVLNGLPRIWNWFKGLFKFARGVEQVKNLPELRAGQDKILDMLDPEAAKTERKEIKEAVAGFKKALDDHMDEEERLRLEEGILVEKMAKEVTNLRDTLATFSIESARTAFRHSVLADEEAYYEIVLEDDEWTMAWVNRAYYDFTGMELNEAQVNPYRSVCSDDYDRVKEAAVYATTHGIPFKSRFMNKNIRTGIETEVEIYSFPVKNLDGEVVSYFGVMRSLEDTEAALLGAMESRASAVFRQVAAASEIANYEMTWSDDTLEWELTWANPAWEKLTGLRWKESATTYHSVMDPEDAKVLAPKLVEQAMKGEGIDMTFDMINAKSGGRCTVRMVGYPVFDMRGKASGYFGALYEID